VTDWGTEENEVYEVSGATLQDVASAMSGQPEAGKYEWFPTYSYNSDGSDGNNITSAEAKVVIKLTMPMWADQDSASPEAQAEWNRFWQALKDHEDGHARLVEQHLDGIEQQLIGKSPTDAATHWQNALNALQQASDDYDNSTNHGIATGTTLDTSIQ